ncbi:MAG: hypothetical protein ACREDS_04105 [Limisphaerales bacterium]
MISKCQCQSCSGEIEFDAAEFQESGRDAKWIFGQSVLCPHCGKETILYLPKSLETETPPGKPRDLSPKEKSYLPSPSPSSPVSRMKPCADCGAPMSQRALWCPACGSIQRGRFGLVFGITVDVVVAMTIISLILLFIGFLIEAVKDAMQ